MVQTVCYNCPHVCVKGQTLNPTWCDDKADMNSFGQKWSCSDAPQTVDSQKGRTSTCEEHTVCCALFPLVCLFCWCVFHILWSLLVLQVFCRMFDCLKGAPQVGLTAWGEVVHRTPALKCSLMCWAGTKCDSEWNVNTLWHMTVFSD